MSGNHDGFGIGWSDGRRCQDLLNLLDEVEGAEDSMVFAMSRQQILDMMSPAENQPATQPAGQASE